MVADQRKMMSSPEKDKERELLRKIDKFNKSKKKVKKGKKEAKR